MIARNTTISIILLLTVASLNVSSQVRKDTLWSVWNDRTQTDSTRLEAYINFGWEVLGSDPDSALILGKKQYELARSKGFKRHMALALNLCGGAYATQLQTDSAILYFQRSYKICEKNGIKAKIDIPVGNIGLIYYSRGDLKNALLYFEKALKINQETGRKKDSRYWLVNSGNVYQDLNDFEKALEFQLRALTISLEIDDNASTVASLVNIGSIYRDMEEYEKSLEYLRRALDRNKVLEHSYTQASILNNLGNTYLKGKYIDSAERCFRQALSISQKSQFMEQMCIAMAGLGDTYYIRKDHLKSLDFQKKAFEIASDLDLTNYQKRTSESLYRLYKALGQTNKALEMHELFTSLNDSLDYKEFKRELARKEFNEQQTLAEEKAKQNVLIEKNKRLEEKQAKEDALRSRSVSIVLFSSLFIISVLAYLIFRKFQRKKQEYQKNLLLKEIELLKSNMARDYLKDSLAQEKKSGLNRENIEIKVKTRINETDWKVLTILVKEPTLSNSDLAEKVFLSYDGVRSSLKRLYSMFDLSSTDKSSIRMRLILSALSYSHKE